MFLKFVFPHPLSLAASRNPQGEEHKREQASACFLAAMGRLLSPQWTSPHLGSSRCPPVPPPYHHPPPPPHPCEVLFCLLSLLPTLILLSPLFSAEFSGESSLLSTISGGSKGGGARWCGVCVAREKERESDLLPFEFLSFSIPFGILARSSPKRRPYWERERERERQVEKDRDNHRGLSYSSVVYTVTPENRRCNRV